MIAYSIFIFIIAALFLILGLLIYNGKTDLIHDYHQKKVKDKSGYAKAFGRVMLLLSIFMILSGVVALLGTTNTIALGSVAVLIIGIIVAVILFIKVQRKYNGGVF